MEWVQIRTKVLLSSFYAFLCKAKNSEYAIKMLILIKESWSKRLNFMHSFTHFKFVHFWNITPEHFSLRNSQAMSFWFSCILVWNVFLPTQQLAFSQQRKFRDGGRSEKIEGGGTLAPPVSPALIFKKVISV